MGYTGLSPEKWLAEKMMMNQWIFRVFRCSIQNIWVWVNTYRYMFSGMNIHLPAILGFTRYQGFDPSPYLHIRVYVYCLLSSFKESWASLVGHDLKGKHVDLKVQCSKKVEVSHCQVWLSVLRRYEKNRVEHDLWELGDDCICMYICYSHLHLFFHKPWRLGTWKSGRPHRHLTNQWRSS